MSVGRITRRPHYADREARLERLNRQSWAVLRAARRIHDETAKALERMLDEARQVQAGEASAARDAGDQ